jgi:hypothetical protein
MLATNVLALGAVADFGAQNCQYTTKVDARQNVQLTTSPAIEPNACYSQWLLFYDLISVSNSIKFSVAKFIKFIVELMEAKISRSSILSITEK